MKTFEPEKVRQFFFIVVLMILGIILFTYLKLFLPSFLGAITLYVLMRKYVKRMIVKKWSPATAALLLMLFSFLIILLPVFVFVNTVSSKIGYVINHSTEITGSVIVFLKNMESRLGYHFLSEETIRNLSGMALAELPLVLGATVILWWHWWSCIFCCILCSPIVTKSKTGWKMCCQCARTILIA